jgi:hypothetical protein
MISPALASALLPQGYDAVSCQEAGLSRLGLTDEQHLAYAAQAGRAILTFDVADYLSLAKRWRAAGRHHAGIILSPEVGAVGELVRRVSNHLDRIEPRQQVNTLLWLQSFPAPNS